MKAKTVYGIYSGIVEASAITFAWFAFEWKVSMLVLLLLWSRKVGRKFASVDRE